MDAVRRRLHRYVREIARESAGVSDLRTFDAATLAINNLLQRSRQRIVQAANRKRFDAAVADLPHYTTTKAAGAGTHLLEPAARN